MKVELQTNGTLLVELSRRNLNALIAKLNGDPPGSFRTIEKDGVAVRAVEDFEHYYDRPPGELHPDTERAMELRYL